MQILFVFMDIGKNFSGDKELKFLKWGINFTPFKRVISTSTTLVFGILSAFKGSNPSSLQMSKIW